MLVMVTTGCAARSSAPPVDGAPAASSGGATERAATQRAAQVEALLRAAHALARQHRPRDAEAPLRQAITLGWGHGAPWRQYRARAQSELSRALLAQGRAAEARAAAEGALALLEPGALAEDQQISEAETTRGEAFRSEQQLGAALAPFTAALRATERHPAQLAPALIAISLRLAETLEALGRRQDAKQTLERALFVAQQPAAGSQLAARLTRALAVFDETRSADRPLPASAGANTARQIAAMQTEFRACYRAERAEERDVAGRVALVLSIAADGHVSNVTTSGNGLPVTTVDCLVRRALLARFEPPKGGAAVITVPVTFVKQEND
jgi:tetratricopeptide (TPR) repeat protein